MLLKQIFFRVLIIVSFIVVGNIGNAFADVNCPANSTYNGSECVCDNGYTKTSHAYDFNVKNPTYSYSGSTFTAEATNIGTIYGESLGWDKGTGSIDASVPAGTYNGKNCWCRIVAPFETNWTYSGGAVAPSSTIPEGSDIWFDECSKRCASKTYSTTIRSFYGNNILNNGEICVKNATPSCDSGYYWDETSQECKYDYELECNNRGQLYYWNGESCEYKDEEYCLQQYGNNYYWNRDTEQCESESDFCPAFSETVVKGPWIETPGQWFDFNSDGQKTLDECVVLRGYANYGHHSQSVVDYPVYRMFVNFESLIGNGDINNSLNVNTIGTGVICRYNPSTHNYDYACTNGINLCSNDEIMDMMQTAGYNSVDLMRYFVGLYEKYSNTSIPESNYKNLFSQSSENTELVDRCSVVDAVCPEHSQIFANGPVAEMVGYGVDFNNDGNITLDECVAGRVYGQIGGVMLEDNTSNSIFERFANFYTLRDLAQTQQTYDNSVSLNDGMLNVAFCKYNSATGNYDNNCTPALSALCSETDLYGINGTNFQTRTMFPYIIERVQESMGMTIPKTSYSMLFTNSSENISTQDICPTCQFGYDDPPFCDMTEYTYCNSGEYLYVDFDNEFYECRQCEIGSYCPYSQDYGVLDGTQGMESCPEGAMSEPGAVDESACFCADDDYMTAEGCVTKDNEYCELEYGSNYYWDETARDCYEYDDSYCEKIYGPYYYWSAELNDCEYDGERECAENYGQYYYWDGETCSEKDDEYCELEYGQYYYWDVSSQTCEYNYEAECTDNGEGYYWENGECKNHITDCENNGGYYYWNTSSQTCRYNYESECDARGEDYIWNNENQECEYNVSVPSVSCENGVVENASSYYPTSELPSVQEINIDVYYPYNGEQYQLLSGSSSSFNLKSAQSAGNSGEGSDAYNQYMAELDYYTSDQGWSVDFNGVTVNGWAVCAANAWKTKGDVKTGVLTGTYGGCACSVDKKTWVVYGNIVSGFSGNWAAKNEHCRKNCPALCAETVASDQEFRQKVFQNSCDIFGGSGGETPTQVVCTANQFAYNNECIDAKFNITTNSINYFEFRISASGRFYVDWGDGKITEYVKTDVASLPIYHTYSDTQSRTIRIGGLANGYSTGAETAAISFANWTGQTNTYDAIEYISGSLAKIFPTLDNGDSLSTQPRFWRTFNGCTNLKGSLDEDLFAELRGQPVEHMFYSTFMGCENITGPIPEHFFGNISGQPASYMFDGTFSGCAKLGSENGIPTYSIPENLFANIHGTTVPHMFPGTFFGCKSLTGEIPHNLFANISGEPKERIFAATFSGCENLSGQIPQDLFANISGSLVDKSFRRTFKDTYSLSGWVPESLFANINNDNHQGDGMLNIFENSGIVTACPEYYYQIETEFDDFWDGRVSCMRCPDGLYSEYGSVGVNSCHVKTYECYSGEYLYVDEDVVECKTCPTGYYCPHGVWTVENADESKVLCPNGTTSGAGTMDEYGCIQTPFEIDVKPYTSQFVFRISAAGTYIINWGDGNIEEIKISEPQPTRISHDYTDYTSGETYTISIGSKNITSYYTGNDDYYGAITFGMVKNTNETNTYDRIIAIRGSLGSVFHTIGNGDSLSTQPRFAYTFNNANNIITPIPHDIFNGVHGAPVDYMFYRTFAGCTGITGDLSEDFFADINGETREAMFSNTFYNCQNIDSEIPANLFAGIYGTPKTAMYSNTFNGCKKLHGNIPSGLFGNIRGNPAINMYSGTFDGCSGLTGQIPAGLFGDIYGDAQGWMYYGTFYGCTNLSGYIPKNLFGRLSGEPEWMMFYQTFYNDSQIIGFKDYDTNKTYRFIPTDLFGTINNVDYDNMNMSMYEMFNGTALYTKCPVGYYKYNTGFDVDLNPKVSCTPCPNGKTTLYEGAVSESECETTEFICSSDKYLRIGDNESDKMCLSENQATHPALAVGVAGNVYYIPLSYTDSYINENSRKKMKILYNGNIYNAHDGSVE